MAGDERRYWSIPKRQQPYIKASSNQFSKGTVASGRARVRVRMQNGVTRVLRKISRRLFNASVNGQSIKVKLQTCRYN